MSCVSRAAASESFSYCGVGDITGGVPWAEAGGERL